MDPKTAELIAWLRQTYAQRYPTWSRNKEIADALEQYANHQCSLPDSIKEALNSGDGTYRP